MTPEATATPESIEERLQAALEVLHGAGLRSTPWRIAILRVLIEAGRHLSLNEIAERVHGSGIDADFSTAWRTVLSLTDIGLVHALHTEVSIPTYGLVDQPHFHAVCQGCDCVAELPAGRLVEAVRQIEQLSGYSMAAGSLLVIGTCPECA